MKGKCICKTCKKKFETYISRILSGRGKFCSKKCQAISRIGKPAWNKGLAGFRKGYKQTEDHIEKKRLAIIGQKRTAKTKELQRQIKLSNPSRYWLGKHRSETTKEKLRQYTGEKTSNWQGGLSFLSYPREWNNRLKEMIRERDNNRCEVCLGEGNGKKLAVHHIDYDKKNLNPNNLISLCNSCHSLTMVNRKYWTFMLEVTNAK